MSDTVQLFIEAWKLMTGRLPSPRMEEAKGVASCFGNVPLIFFNISIVYQPAATADELRALLDTAAERAATCEHPSSVLFRQDWLPVGWEAPVKEAGLALIVPMTGMEGGELLPPRRLPAQLEIRRVADDSAARDLAELNARAYGMPVDLFECLANMRLWQADSYAFLGYVEGKPVSTATVLPVSGTVYIALVATSPDEQGNGYAETLVRHAVTQGRQAMGGAARTSLHASQMGLPVYRAMGYKTGPKLLLFGPEH